ncbi:MAG: Crp/Fnr family transcriptional regulator [Chitinophagaceae bacterium]|nr:Crp/Fnr family transcriptional regulator [Chitinophagaceae bacterium]
MELQITTFFKLLDPNNTLNQAERDLVISTARLISIKKNYLLQHIGQTCRTIYYIQKGCTRVFYLHEDTEVTECFNFEGELAVRFESLLAGVPSRRAIQALEPTQLIALDLGKLETIFTVFPRIEVMFRRLFHTYHIQTLQRMEHMQFHSAEERYQLLLENQPEVIKRIPLKFIASYL